MNTNLKYVQKNMRALSPVVASIILIAVTVAVSVAVAAWMGGMSLGFMNTEELKITSVTFDVDSDVITVIANNAGTTAVTINAVWVNNVAQSNLTFTPATGTAAANSGLTIEINYDGGVETGASYQIKLISAKGNTFIYTASAPS